MHFVLRTGPGHENLQTSRNLAIRGCIAQLRIKRGLYRKKLKKYILSTNSIAYQASKPITKCKCFVLSIVFIQAPRIRRK